MHIAVCESKDIYEMKESVESAKKKLGISWDFIYFSEGTELLSIIENNHLSYDGIIIGSTPKDIDGMEVGRQIRYLAESTELAFVSDSEKNALEAFQLNAVHYVLKPVTAEKMEEIFRRFAQRIGKVSEVLNIKANRKTASFPITNIVKIQSSKKRIEVYLTDKKDTEKVSVSFKNAEAQIAEQTAEKQLVRISRGLIVNMDYISGIKNGACFLKDGTSILISRASKIQVEEKYTAYQEEKLRKKKVYFEMQTL